MNQIWTRLREVNAWGAIHYVTATGNKPLLMEEGSPIKVRFPNGKIGIVRLKERKTMVEVPDHGHTYRVEQCRCGFMLDVFGVKAWVPITDVEVFVTLPEEEIK